MIMVASTIPFILMVATILLQYSTTPSKAAIVVQLERVEQIGGEQLVDSSEIRVRKFNRTTFALNGTFELFQDLDDTYEASLGVEFSRLGNNQWNVYPMKIPQKKTCQVMIKEYPQYQDEFINNTNLPYIPKGTQRFCPFPKGRYWVRDLAPGASWVPSVVPAGYWRMTLESWRRGKLLALFRVYYRITK